MESNSEHILTVVVDKVPGYQCSLKLSDKAGGAAKMTTLLYVVDLMMERTGIKAMANNKTQLYFDEEHMTTPDEVLKTLMDKVIIKRQGEENPFTDILAAHIEDHEMIYLNDKE
jgi:hypothetical protein